LGAKAQKQAVARSAGAASGALQKSGSGCGEDWHTLPPQVGHCLKVASQRIETASLAQRLATVLQTVVVPSQVTELVPVEQDVAPKQLTVWAGAEQLMTTPEAHSRCSAQALLQTKVTMQLAWAPRGAAKAMPTSNRTIPIPLRIQFSLNALF
jgi:hypothetical protein